MHEIFTTVSIFLKDDEVLNLSWALGECASRRVQEGRAGVRSDLDAASAEELLERGVHVLFVVDADAYEALAALEPVVED
jgi:hypothetical protein